MRLDKKFKPETVASTDEGRLIINSVHVCPAGTVGCVEGSCVEAADGRVLVVLPAEMDDKDIESVIPVDVWRTARAANGGPFELWDDEADEAAGFHTPDPPEVRVYAKGQVEYTTTEGVAYIAAHRLEGNYPNTDRVIKAAYESGKVTAADIALDPSLISKVAEAMGIGYHGLRFIISGPLDPVILCPANHQPVRDGRWFPPFAILMPVRTDGGS